MSTCEHTDRSPSGLCRPCNAEAARRYRATENGREVVTAYEASPERREAHRERVAAFKATPEGRAAYRDSMRRRRAQKETSRG
jgi:hypothetical protein